jgi:hypothetical protein
MNIRNLFLMSMMVCAAPIVCVVPEVTLTKQEQEIIKKWIQEINIKKQDVIVQEVAKLYISSFIDSLLVCLSKMPLGESKLAFEYQVTHESEMFMINYSNGCEQLMKKLTKDRRINERQGKVICEHLSQLKIFFDTLPLNQIITNEEFAACSVGEYITELNRTKMKKIIAVYSFMLKCL